MKSGAKIERGRFVVVYTGMIIQRVIRKRAPSKFNQVNFDRGYKISSIIF